MLITFVIQMSTLHINLFGMSNISNNVSRIHKQYWSRISSLLNTIVNCIFLFFRINKIYILNTALCSLSGFKNSMCRPVVLSPPALWWQQIQSVIHSPLFKHDMILSYDLLLQAPRRFFSLETWASGERSRKGKAG